MFCDVANTGHDPKKALRAEGAELSPGAKAATPLVLFSLVRGPCVSCWSQVMSKGHVQRSGIVRQVRWERELLSMLDRSPAA